MIIGKVKGDEKIPDLIKIPVVSWEWAKKGMKAVTELPPDHKDYVWIDKNLLKT